MVVSDKHKFIFLAVPRTGSKSTEAFLVDYGLLTNTGMAIHHGNVRTIKSHVGDEKWSSYKKAAFVRNPWDWYPSVFIRMRTHRQRYGGTPLNVFADFLKLNKTDNHLKDFIADPKGKIAVDFIGRFESFEDEVRRLAEFLGLPIPKEIRNTTDPHKSHYTKYYTEDWMIEQVAKEEKFVIDMFGYKYGEGGIGKR